MHCLAEIFPRTSKGTTNNKRHSYLDLLLCALVIAATSSSFGIDLWSAASTWPNEIPEAGEIVTIPAGSSIYLDTDTPALGGLRIEGELIFTDQNLRLTSRWILVDGGQLTIGSQNTPYSSKAQITLTGTSETENIAAGHGHIGTKFIGAVNGGTLELHGTRAQTRNWTQLAEHALTNATQLTLAQPVEWKTGDRLVIAPSGFDPTEAEEVTITSINNQVVQFTPALQHDHWGELQTIGGHIIDERAEVACLTRNILIQGNEASANSDFGGHLMFGPNTTIHIEGVEFNRMGQKGHAARYPIHWHLAGNRSGDYARGNSIHHSYHRAIVTHGTSNVLVENNVAFDVRSHTYVPSENGTERGNRYIGNLGILTRRLAVADYTFPESAAGASFQSEGRPGIFWMQNPDHILIGNHAAGVVNGMGFFYDGPSLDNSWTGIFANNVAHACFGPTSSTADQYPSTTVGYGLFMEDQTKPEEIRFTDFTAYKNSLSGIWLEAPSQIAKNATLADNGIGAILFQSTLEDSVIVGQSANTIGDLPQIGTSKSGGIQILSGSSLKAPQLRNIDFIDQRDAGIVMLDNKLHPLSTFENLTFQNTQPPCWIEEPDQLVGGFTDLDGSLRSDGIPVFIHGKEPLAKTDETIFDATINAWVTPLSALQYLSLTDLNPEAEEIGYTTLSRETEIAKLPDTSLSGQSPTLSAYLKKNSTYRMGRFDPLPEGIRISITGKLSDHISLEISEYEAAFVYHEATTTYGISTPDFENPAPFASTIAEVIESDQAIWFHDPSTQTLHQRLDSNQAIFAFKQQNGILDLNNPETLWRFQNFGYFNSQDNAADSRWGDSGDPDRDGLENQLEYFLDTNPLHASNPLTLDPSQRRLSFSINPEASEFNAVVSYSSDLVNWLADTEIQTDFLPDDIVRMNATAPSLDSDQFLFMKLEVQRTP